MVPFKKFKTQLYPSIIKNWLIIVIFAIGIFVRVYDVKSIFYFGHDQDLIGWFVKDVVVDGHIRLIGQETSTSGIFIGPLFYYLQIPFYILFTMSPLGGVFLVSLLSAFGLVSSYFVFAKMFDKKVAASALLVFAISYYIVLNDREVVPTMPVFIWSIWFLYAIHLYLKNSQKLAFIIWGILISLIWHINFALILLAPVGLITILLSKHRVSVRNAFAGLIVFLIGSMPLIIFEMRHGFGQVKSGLISLTSNQHDIISGFDKLTRVIHLAAKDATSLFIGNLPVKYEYVFYTLIGLLFYIALKKLISRTWFVILSTWILSYILFFSMYSKVVSEYYLNGLIVVFVLIFSVFVGGAINHKKFKFVGYFILVAFILANLDKFLNAYYEKSSYYYRREIVSRIKDDALAHNYPCIAISYIASPGYDLGWRYLYYLEDMHVNRPSSGSPVYTIVYPMKPVFKEDIAFGAIGLIYPDYQKYNPDDVVVSCSGENSNLTDPVFGFTK